MTWLPRWSSAFSLNLMSLYTGINSRCFQWHCWILWWRGLHPGCFIRQLIHGHISCHVSLDGDLGTPEYTKFSRFSNVRFYSKTSDPFSSSSSLWEGAQWSLGVRQSAMPFTLTVSYLWLRMLLLCPISEVCSKGSQTRDSVCKGLTVRLESQGCSSMVECLPSTYKALGLFSNIAKT